MKPMHKVELRDALASMNITQAALAEMLGLNQRTGRKYANGETAIPNPVALLVRMLRDASDARVANMVLAARMGMRRRPRRSRLDAGVGVSPAD